MTIPSHTDKHDFGKELNRLLSPSHPVQTIEFLKGRERELTAIERALFAEGRHIFIFGDRGVGKSSLAATAAYQYQSSDGKPIFVSAAHDATFQTIIANIANKALGRSKTEAVKNSESIGLEWHGLKWAAGQEVNPVDVASRIPSVSDAAELLYEVGMRHSQKPIVVIDEFDTLGSAEERNKFAHLLKHLGDKNANIKIIFTGIGSSLEELLGAHLSAYRQLAQIELPRLGFDARREIVENTAASFGMSLDNEIEWRIPMISDGYPYYVHLMTEHMLWAAFDDPKEVHTLTWGHHVDGLQSAIALISGELKKPYQRAVMYRDSEVEDVVWSTAVGEDLERQLSDMYEAYRVVARQRERLAVLESTEYSEAVRRLKEPGYGSILAQVKGRPRWYTYNEKMLRGYVRMQAAAQGIELSQEREAPRPIMHVSNVRTGFHGPSIPKGVNVHRGMLGDDEQSED